MSVLFTAVLNALRQLSTTTSILSDPSRMPEHATEAVLKTDKSTGSWWLPLRQSVLRPKIDSCSINSPKIDSCSIDSCSVCLEQCQKFAVFECQGQSLTVRGQVKDSVRHFTKYRAAYFYLYKQYICFKTQCHLCLLFCTLMWNGFNWMWYSVDLCEVMWEISAYVFADYFLKWCC